MKLSIGTDTEKTSDNLCSSLKENDIVYSCTYDASTKKVTFDAYKFIEYVKGPDFKDNTKVARFYELDPETEEIVYRSLDDGTKKPVTCSIDVGYGVYRDKRDAGREFTKELQSIVDAVSLAVQDLSKSKM